MTKEEALPTTGLSDLLGILPMVLERDLVDCVVAVKVVQDPDETERAPVFREVSTLEVRDDPITLGIEVAVTADWLKKGDALGYALFAYATTPTKKVLVTGTARLLTHMVGPGLPQLQAAIVYADGTYVSPQGDGEVDAHSLAVDLLLSLEKREGQ